MEREEVELLPAGLVTCFLDGIEVRILKISPQKLTVRINEEINDTPEIKTVFYIFDEYKYEEVVLKNCTMIEKVNGQFSLTYIFSVNDNIYANNVRRITRDYSKYVMLKNYGEDNEFSEEMVGYPAELDYDFYNYYSEQKRDWMWHLNYTEWNNNIIDSVELAINIDNDLLYKKYMDNDIRSFKYEYLKDNYADEHELFQKDVSRIYIGNEFCHNLFPDLQLLIEMLNKSKDEELDVTLCFTYMRDCFIEKTKKILDDVYIWCRDNNKSIEIIVNDWGIIKLIEGKNDFFKPLLGVLLNKRKKDPRYIYKKGYNEHKDMMSKNSLNSSVFTNFLKNYKIERYEFENCGYRISIAEGNHSLHVPFYVTNTSQYCTLYAMCTNMDRGNQKLVIDCPKYCRDYVFAYPKHLKMIGRYNSLFAFDDTLLKDTRELEYYINNGIDRIVLNFI